MSGRARRLVAMTSATIAIVGLAFVVAVASSSRPGEGDEPWLEVSFRTDIDLTPVFAWITLIAAVIGAVLFALSLREAAPKTEKRGKKMWGYVVGIILFLVAVRFLQPVAESTFTDFAEASETAGEAGTEGGGGFWVGWIITVLIAAIVAAALTRIGLSIRSGQPIFDVRPESTGPGAVLLPAKALPRRRELGSDARSRVLNAYGEFEDAAGEHGSPRLETETEGRHAGRAHEELGLDRSDVDLLVGRHAEARYGDDAISNEDADSASDAADRLKREMES